ncbi:MAG: hypothetical protein EB078_10225 [Proteobacteria bacterium]|nr:hypothetical protein [Pseudomonadota bacterium]NDD05271.1 hypothetical protein [Pseudomonadota bacterium]
MSYKPTQRDGIAGAIGAILMFVGIKTYDYLFGGKEEKKDSQPVKAEEKKDSQPAKAEEKKDSQPAQAAS